MSNPTNVTKTDSNITVELVPSNAVKLTCCISVCRNYKNPASIIDLYPIPKNAIHRQLWCKTFSIPEEVAELPTARVCALHFRSKMGLPPLPAEVPLPPSDNLRDSSTIRTLADPQEIFLAVLKDDRHLTMIGTPCVVPASQSLPTEKSLDFSTTPGSILEPVLSIQEGPDLPNVQNLESEITNNTNTNVMTSSDDSSESNSVISSNMLLALECDEEPLSDTQNNIYLKDVMEFLTANETVYRLVHTPFSPKFPSMGKCSNEISDKSNLASNSTLHYYPEQSNLQNSGDGVSLPTLNSQLIQMPALNSSSVNVMPSSFVFTPNTKPENSSTVSTPSLSSPQMVPVNFNSTSVTDVTGKFSFLRDGNGQILNQNFCSNLSIDGNVIFSKSLTLSTSNAKSILASQLPSQLIPIAPKSLITTGNLPLLQNINSECDNLKYSSNKNVTPNAVSILKNNTGYDNGAAVLSPSWTTPKFHFLTPLSTVQMFQNVNTPPVNVSSSQQGNSTTLSTMVNHPVNNQPSPVNQTVLMSGPPSSLPSTVAFSFAPITNSSEVMRFINTSCSGSFPMSSLNSSKEQMRGIPVMSQVGLNSVTSASYQLMKLTEKARGSPSFVSYPVPASCSENVIPVALQRVEPHCKSRPRPSVIDPSYVEEILPPPIKGLDHVYTDLNDDHDSRDSPLLPVVPIVEYKSGDDASEDGVAENDCSNIPVIVDVISAKEGATEFFIEDKMPQILIDKSKKMSIESFGKDCIDNSQSNGSGNSKKIECRIKDSESQFICYKSSSGDIIVSKLHSIFALQREIPAIPSGTEPMSNIRRAFSIKCGSLKNRLDDADNLRKRLKEEKFVSVSALWILQKKYFPKIPSCNACGHTVFTLDRSDRFRDGFCYTCNNSNCRSEIPVPRPTFFERFRNFSLENLLLLTYHWACMSSLQEILTDIDLEVEDIWRYFKALQHLCRDINVKKGILGICPKSYVEAAVVKLGNYFILGAFDRKSGSTRLEVLSEEEAFESMHPIKLLTRWLYPNATLICEQKIPDGVIPGIKTTCAEYDVTDPQCPLPHILNIYCYLTKGLSNMFDKLNHHKLSKEFITGFLSERQWRDKFGRTVELAFWTILAHIRDLNVSEVAAKRSATVIAGKVFSIPRVNSSNDGLCQMRWGPFSTVKKVPQDQHLLTQKAADFSGVVKPIKSYSNPYVKIPPKLPETNKLCADDIASYFQDVPEIPGANLYLTSKSMLAIKIRFDESDQSANAYNVDAISLGLRLRKEGFISSPVRWLVAKGYIKSSSLCYVCNGTAYLRDNPKFSDGCSWSCQNKMCQFENVFKRPRFFSRFPQQPMAHISAMIFHWTVQSDTAIITSDAPMDLVKISHAWRAFQLLCCSALKRERSKIGGQSLLVEVALVQYGKKYVLGAYDRGSKLSFLKAFHGHMLTFDTLSSTLKSWINPGTYIIVNADKALKLPPEFRLAFADTNVTDKKSPTYHVLNITSYLLNHVSFMFGHLRADVVRLEAMQVFLDELMWRERNGRKPQLAFSKIMHEIFYNEWSGKSYEFTEDEKELAAQQNSSSPIKLKEARVVLRRIPKTVLKYYNCLPLDSTEDKNTSSSFDLESLTHPVSSVATCATLENLVPLIPNKHSGSSRENLTPTLIRKCTNEDEFVVVDDDDNNDKSLSTERISNFLQNQGASISSKQDAEDKPTGYSSKSSNSGASTSHSMDSIKILNSNSVQPLVINVCRKNKKTKFYIKSDSSSVTTSNENSVDSSIYDESTEETESNLLRLTENSNSDPCTDVPLGEKIELEISKPSSSKLKRRIEEKHECIECGNHVSLDHFMKKFSCTDCKKCVYTTCCSSAFFEHRKSLLFGKFVMPRRYKEHKGFHKSIRLSHSWFCNCGYSSVYGNHLASHLVKCQKTTCYRTNQSQ